MQACDQGLLEFNNGFIRAFLFRNRWYPLRAAVNCARRNAGQKEVNTDRALVELAYLLPYIKIEDVEFKESFPVEIDSGSRLQQIGYLSQLIVELTK